MYLAHKTNQFQGLRFGVHTDHLSHDRSTAQPLLYAYCYHHVILSTTLDIKIQRSVPIITWQGCQFPGSIPQHCTL